MGRRYRYLMKQSRIPFSVLGALSLCACLALTWSDAGVADAQPGPPPPRVEDVMDDGPPPPPHERRGPRDPENRRGRSREHRDDRDFRRGPDGERGRGGPMRFWEERLKNRLRDPEFRKMMFEKIFGDERLTKLEEQDPDLYRAIVAEKDKEQEINRMVRKYRKTNNAPQKEELRDEIEKEGAVYFDLQTERQALELIRMRARLERLEANLEDRKERRDSLLKEHIEKVLNQEPKRRRGDPPWGRRSRPTFESDPVETAE